MGQKPSEGKRVHNIFQSCLIKNLARKTQWDKTIDKGKRVQGILLPLFTTWVDVFGLAKSCHEQIFKKKNLSL